MLARLFARPANVLVLDEPTNDLDIDTLELLEELVADFDGTVLLVTHDRVFLDNVVTSTLAFEGEGRIAEYVGGYADYLRQRREAPAPRKPAPRPQRASGAAREGRRKKTFNEEREYAALPARIEALEAEQAVLQAEAAAPDFYKAPAARIKEVLARIDAIHAELDAALARWVELEETG
jgi:ATP-binding cassette subfamily F protein uup